LAGRLAAHAVPSAPERFGKRLPFSSALGDRSHRSVETRWFGHSLCTTTSGPAHRVRTGRSVEACWTSSVSDRATLGGRRFVSAIHLRAGILFELGLWTPLCSVHLAAPCSPRCRNTSARDVAVRRGRRGSPYPPRRDALERVCPSVQSSNQRSVSLWSATPEMQRDFAGEIGRLGQRRRPRRNAADSVFPSNRTVQPTPAGSTVRLRAETLRLAASPTGDTVERAFPRHRSATVEHFRGEPSGHPPVQSFPPHRTRIVFDSRLVIRETLQTGPSGCFRLGCPRGAETLQVQLRHRRPSSHLPFRTACALHVGSRLADRPLALRPQPSRQSLLRRRSTSVGTVVWTRPWSVVPDGGAGLLSAKTRWSPTSPSARAIRTATPSAEALGLSILPAVPASGCPERSRSPRRRSALNPNFTLGTHVRLCASKSSTRLEESSVVGDSSAQSARWARALRGSATPRIARDLLGPRPDRSLVRTFSQKRRRVR
jgi:hypothetical protein